MQEERRLEKEAREEEQERTKREVEEGEGGSQEKKQKVMQEAPPSYWDWLPLELKEDIEKKSLYALIKERLDKGFREIHNEMAELPRCRLHGTVGRFFLIFYSHVLLLDLSAVFFSFLFVVDVSLDVVCL